MGCIVKHPNSGSSGVEGRRLVKHHDVDASPMHGMRADWIDLRTCTQGFAYIEFLEAEAVSSAALLEGSELRGRQIKVHFPLYISGLWA